MDLSAALSNLAQGAGAVQIATTEQEARQAEASNAKAVAQMHQMEALSMKQTLDTRKAIAQESQGVVQQFQQSAKTDQDLENFSRQMAAISLGKGDFDGAKHYEEEVKRAADAKKESLANAAAEGHAKNEATAQAAYAYTEAPSTGAADALEQAAQRAGVDPKTIPQRGSPEYASWAVGMQKKAVDSAKRLELKQKDDEFHVRQAEIAQKDREVAQARTLAQQDKALAQAGIAEDRKARLAIERQLADAHTAELRARSEAEAAKAKGGDAAHLTAKQRDTADAVAAMAHEGARSLHGFEAMPAGSVAGMFSDLTQHGVTTALTAAGARLITADEAKMFATNAAGFARAVLSSETLGMGRSPTGAQIEDMHRAIVPQEGDGAAVAAYKLATGNAIILNRLETRHTNPDPKVEARLVADEAYMRTLATPEEVYEAARKNPKALATLERQKVTADAYQAKIKSMAESGGASASSALPPGFTEDK
jgi:hypothetical protein